MTVVRYSDYASAIRYALSSNATGNTAVEIRLDLFRGSAPVSRTTLARVDRRHADTVLLRCRRDLERRGLHAVSRAAPPLSDAAIERPDPRDHLPVAAFDWMFEAG